MSIQRILLSVFCFLALSLPACRDSGSREELAAKDKIIEDLNARLAASEQQVKELEARLAKTQGTDKPQDALKACEKQLTQLRATLNRAYLDMKIALVERDACCQRLGQGKQDTTRKPPPSEKNTAP